MQTTRIFLLALLMALLAATAALADDAATAAAPVTTITPLQLADPNAAGFGVDKYFVGATVDTAALEAEGFALDDYYSPETYYSKEVDMQFPFGTEAGRLDIGIDDQKVIYRIVYEINNVWASDDGETLETRENMQDVLGAIAEALDNRYSDWDSEQWAHEDPNLHVDVMDMFDDNYALSFRISALANTLIYTTYEERETKADWPDTTADDAAPETKDT